MVTMRPVTWIGVRLDFHHFHADAGLAYVRCASTDPERYASAAWQRFQTHADA